MARLIKSEIHGLHILVIATLVGLSIYNGYYVIHDYIYENTMTTALVKTSTSIFPFAKYATVRFLFNGSFSIFSHPLQANESEYGVPHGYDGPAENWYAIKRLEKRYGKQLQELGHFGNGSKLSADQKIDATCVTTLLDFLDREFMKDFTGQLDPYEATDADEFHAVVTEFFANLSSGLDAFGNDMMNVMPNGKYKPSVFQAIDRILENSTFDTLIDRILAELDPYNDFLMAVGGLERAGQPKPTYIVDHLTYSGLHVTIPLGFLANQTTEEVVFAFVPIPKPLPPVRFFSVTFSQYFTSDLPAQALDSSTDDDDTPLRASMELKNSGIYDSIEVRGKECQRCENASSPAHCQFQCQLVQIVRECKCLPFTYRRLYTEGDKRPKYCTVKDYARCLKNSENEATSGNCRSEKSMPCVVQKNSETLATDTSRYVLYTNGTPDDLSTFRFYLRLVCKNGIYIVFQEKYQNNWMQMLGQLGGNLGVFLSFSLFGAWQMVMYSHQLYRERQRRSAAEATSSSSITAVWLRMAQLNIETAATSGFRSGREEKSENLKIEIEKLKAKCETATRENEVVKERSQRESATMEARLRALEEAMADWNERNGITKRKIEAKTGDQEARVPGSADT